MIPQRVTVRVPATTANLGPAFDCMGIALDLHNFITVERADRFAIVNEGEGADRLPTTSRHRVYQAMERAFACFEQPIPRVVLRCRNHIPLLRGLGSSAAAVVGGLVAANALAGSPVSREALLPLAVALEGHPDNAAPALLGGCQLVARDKERWVAVHIPLPPDLRFVLFIPDFPMSTAKAREVLPHQVSRETLVFNMARTALLVTAFATNRLELLALATEDQVHQPARQAMFPAMPRIIQAARDAGALGAFLSGAGSTIVALVKDEPQPVAEAMAKAGPEHGVKGQTRVVQAAFQGAQVIEAA